MNTRGRRRGSPDAGSTKRSRRNLSAPSVTLSSFSFRPIACPARWIGCVAARPKRLAHQDRLNWSWPASFKGPADPAKEPFSRIEPIVKPSLSMRDVLTPELDVFERSNEEKSCCTPRKAFTNAGLMLLRCSPRRVPANGTPTKAARSRKSSKYDEQHMARRRFASSRMHDERRLNALTADFSPKLKPCSRKYSTDSVCGFHCANTVYHGAQHGMRRYALAMSSVPS